MKLEDFNMTLAKAKLTNALGLSRCPHCTTAHPTVLMCWQPVQTKRADGLSQNTWAGFACTTCGSVVSARCSGSSQAGFVIDELFPRPKTVDEDIPETPRRFLEQALNTLHAPDAAAVMAGSAVDSMLKLLELKEGSVYARINQAVEANLMTKSMGEWAHSVRLGANRPRHSDEKNPHVSPEEAVQSVEFATALGHFLFVLTAKVARGIEKAKQASASAPTT